MYVWVLNTANARAAPDFVRLSHQHADATLTAEPTSSRAANHAPLRRRS
jgi:hypothetical protein